MMDISDKGVVMVKVIINALSISLTLAIGILIYYFADVRSMSKGSALSIYITIGIVSAILTNRLKIKLLKHISVN